MDSYIDVPTFVLANVVVDTEPLAVMVFGLDYPLHGYCHTLLIGSLIGILWGIIAYSVRGILQRVMESLRLPYSTTLRKMLISAILGVWLHVIMDSFMHSDIRPFFPSNFNPMYGVITVSTLYLICAVSFIPALMIYGIKVFSLSKHSSKGE